MDIGIGIFLLILLAGNLTGFWLSHSLAEREKAVGMNLIMNMTSLALGNLLLGLQVGSLESFFFSLLLILPIALIGASLFWLGPKETVYISLVWLALIGVSNFLPGLPFFRFYFVYISGLFDSPYIILAIGYFLFISPAISYVIAQGTVEKLVSSKPILLAGFSTLLLVLLVITNPLVGASFEAGKVSIVKEYFDSKYPKNVDRMSFQYKPEKEIVRPFFLFYPFVKFHVVEYNYLGHKGNVLLENGNLQEGFHLLLNILEGRVQAQNQLEHLLGTKLQIWFDQNNGWVEGDKLYMRYDGQVFPPLFGRFMFQGVLFSFEYNDQGLVGVPKPMLENLQNHELFDYDHES